MVSISPPVDTHTISANGRVIAPDTRFILSLLISPDGVRMPLSIRGWIDVFMVYLLNFEAAIMQNMAADGHICCFLGEFAVYLKVDIYIVPRPKIGVSIWNRTFQRNTL